MIAKDDIRTRALLMLKLTNSLNDADLAEINALIEHDPAVAKEWKEIYEFYSKEKQHKREFNNVSASDIMKGVREKMKVKRQPSEEEQARLNELFKNEPDAKEVWNFLQEHMDNENLNNKSFEGLSESELTAEILTRRSYIKNKTSPVIKLLLAAAVIGAAIFIYTISKTNHSPKTLSDAQKTIPDHSVYLQLENNEIIDLSNAEQYPKTVDEQIKLKNSHNELTFSTDRGNVSRGKLVVPKGKEYSLRLADGTQIRLNAGSTLEFPFGLPGNTREITITGEAYVNVATLAEKPFIVHTALTDIQVLGTEFNVNTYNPEQATISLVQGAVKVKAGKEEVILKPGLQADYTTQKGINTYPFDKNNVLSWLEGKYQFNGTPLKEIIPILERWFDVTIKADDPTVIEKTFKGDIRRADGIKPFLDMLETVRDAQYYYKNDTIHIKRYLPA